MALRRDVESLTLSPERDPEWRRRRAGTIEESKLAVIFFLRVRSAAAVLGVIIGFVVVLLSFLGNS